MGDGELGISAYDTAWVALIKNIDGSDINAPQFPSCLKWIADNQLPHGSWGDDKVFLAHDRLINSQHFGLYCSSQIMGCTSRLV